MKFKHPLSSTIIALEAVAYTLRVTYDVANDPCIVYMVSVHWTTHPNRGN